MSEDSIPIFSCVARDGMVPVVVEHANGVRTDTAGTSHGVGTDEHNGEQLRHA